MKPTKAGTERIVYRGKIIEVVLQSMNITGKNVEFEFARRAPGVRLLIVQDKKILLSKEYRSELEDFDYRLPGGKVFDTLEEYNRALKTGANLIEAATEAAERECLEEVGLTPTSLQLLQMNTAGATIEWNLYYFLVKKFEQAIPDPEDGEIIEPVWKTFSEVKEMCLNGQIQEDRTVAVLLRFLLSKKH